MFMFYIIYKTTNKVNGKYYVGAHKTLDLHDDYLGSGKHLVRAIEKYGVENFTREILYVFNNPEDMYSKEKEIVNEEFVSNELTYNLKIGGFGGWDHVDISTRVFTEESKRKMSQAARKRQLGEGNSFYGKRHSDETKKLIGVSSKQRAKTIYENRIKNGNHPNSFGNCPHCNKHGQLRALKRWHFNNCPILKIAHQASCE
jgi:group I intron endonuclease